ncbi:hypothetical protein SBA3_3540015 [Candidatus Sulfopaludibacter sp. SbA3]|nr:hypothetical protein SBA3_3540015 [Candidatus Sulfopaludibacter sp. SbA3]
MDYPGTTSGFEIDWDGAPVYVLQSTIASWTQISFGVTATGSDSLTLQLAAVPSGYKLFTSLTSLCKARQVRPSRAAQCCW